MNPVIDFYLACDRLGDAFLDAYYSDSPRYRQQTYWVDAGRILCVWDHFYSLQDVVFAVEHKVPECILREWYDNATEYSCEGMDKGLEREISTLDVYTKWRLKRIGEEKEWKYEDFKKFREHLETKNKLS